MIGRRGALALAGGFLARPVRAQDRVLALGGAVTETVFALGAGETLVGSDQTSLYPPAAAALPKTGYLRALGAEGVLSLRPGLVLASADAGPPAALAQVAAAGVRIVTLPEAHAPEAALVRAALVGEALGRAAAAAALAETLRADLALVRGEVARARPGVRVLFLLSTGRGAPMAAGAETAAAAMLHLAGAENAVQGFRGYKPLSAEAALAAAPDVIVTTAQDGMPGLDVPVMRFDALYLLGFGPRLAHALGALAAAIRPEETLRQPPPRPWVGT